MSLRKSMIVLFLVLSLNILSIAALRVHYSSTGEVVVYDDVAKLAWYKNMSDTSIFFEKNYFEQVEIVAGMNQNSFHGLGGWRIATNVDLNKLLLNKLSDIALYFDLDWFGNTGVGSGRYENNARRPRPNTHNYFTICELLCCEPFDTSATGYGGFPYMELIEYPGPGNDQLYYAVPRPSTGNTPDLQLGDSMSTNIAAWVVTGSVAVGPDGSLIPGEEAVPDPCASMSTYLISVDSVIDTLYQSISFTRGNRPKWALFQCLFIPDAVISASRSVDIPGIMTPSHVSVSQFILLISAALRMWSVDQLVLNETNRAEEGLGDLSHVKSTFAFDLVARRRGLVGNPPIKTRIEGILSIELSRDGLRWKIVSLAIGLKKLRVPTP